MLDYLSQSQSFPLYLHPHHLYSTKFTKTVKDLVQSKDLLLAASEGESVKAGLRSFIHIEFAWSGRYKSDLSKEYFHSSGAVTPLLTANSSQSHHILLVNSQDMTVFFKNRMRALTQSMQSMAGSAPEVQVQSEDSKISRETLNPHERHHSFQAPP